MAIKFRVLPSTPSPLSVRADCDFYHQNPQVTLLHPSVWHRPADPKSFFFSLHCSSVITLLLLLLLCIFICVTVNLHSSVLALGNSVYASFRNGNNECHILYCYAVLSDVSNIDHLIPMRCSAGKPWVLAFMWMPLDMHWWQWLPSRTMCPDTWQTLLRNSLRNTIKGP